jgi:hypothetical protein
MRLGIGGQRILLLVNNLGSIVLLLRHDLPSHGILDLGLTRTLLGSSRQMGWLAFVMTKGYGTGEWLTTQILSRSRSL